MIETETWKMDGFRMRTLMGMSKLVSSGGVCGCIGRVEVRRGGRLDARKSPLVYCTNKAPRWTTNLV